MIPQSILEVSKQANFSKNNDILPVRDGVKNLLFFFGDSLFEYTFLDVVGNCEYQLV
jgi:hypothetical protein